MAAAGGGITAGQRPIADPLPNPRMDPLRYGDFEVLVNSQGEPALLGEGTSGATYKAVRRETVFGGTIETFVAVKVIKPGRLDSERKQAQHVRELQVLSKVRSNHVVRYLQQGEERGELYYAMEFCSGGDLGTFSASRGGLTPAEVAVFGAQAAEGLKGVHETGFVHCDVKPANLLLDQQPGGRGPQVKLSDFGSVQHCASAGDSTTAEDTLSGEPFRGSPMFASPEQLRQHRLDQRSDLYSLGITFWFLLLGRKPVEGGLAEIQAWHLDPAPHRIELPGTVPEGLVKLIGWLVEKEPGKRPGSADEVLEALRGLQPEAGAGPAVAAGPAEPTLESRYEVDYGKRVTSAFGYRFPARRLAGGESVDLLFVHPEFAGREETEAHLKRLEAASRSGELPAGLLRVHGHSWFGEDLVVGSDPRETASLADHLMAREGGVLPPEEALGLLVPVAEALDFLEKRRLPGSSLGLNDILVSRLAEAPAPGRAGEAAAGAGGRCLAQIDPLLVPPAGMRREASVEGAGDGTHTITATTALWGGVAGLDQPNAVALAGLLYRLVVGLELPEAARMSVSAFTPTQKLGDQSNAFLREVIAGQCSPMPSCARLLERLYENEDLPVPASLQLLRPEPPPFPRLPRSTSVSTSHDEVATTGMRTGTTSTASAAAGIRSAVVTATAAPHPAVPAPQKAPATAPVAPTTGKGRGKLVVLAAAAGVVLLGVAGGGTILLLKHLRKPEAVVVPAVVAGGSEPAAAKPAVEPAKEPPPKPEVPPPVVVPGPAWLAVDQGIFPGKAGVRVNDVTTEPEPLDGSVGCRIDLRDAKWPCTLTLDCPGYQPQKILLRTDGATEAIKADYDPPMSGGPSLIRVRDNTAEYQGNIRLKRAEGEVTVRNADQTDSTQIYFKIKEALEGEKEYVTTGTADIQVGLTGGGGTIKTKLPTGRYQVVFRHDRQSILPRLYRKGELIDVRGNAGAEVTCPPTLAGTYELVDAEGWRLEVKPNGSRVFLSKRDGDQWGEQAGAESYGIDGNGVLTASLDFDQGLVEIRLQPGVDGQEPELTFGGDVTGLPKSSKLRRPQ